MTCKSSWIVRGNIRCRQLNHLGRYWSRQLSPSRVAQSNVSHISTQSTMWLRQTVCFRRRCLATGSCTVHSISPRLTASICKANIRSSPVVQSASVTSSPRPMVRGVHLQQMASPQTFRCPEAAKDQRFSLVIAEHRSNASFSITT